MSKDSAGEHLQKAIETLLAKIENNIASLNTLETKMLSREDGLSFIDAHTDYKKSIAEEKKITIYVNDYNQISEDLSKDLNNNREKLNTAYMNYKEVKKTVSKLLESVDKKVYKLSKATDNFNEKTILKKNGRTRFYKLRAAFERLNDVNTNSSFQVNFNLQEIQTALLQLNITIIKSKIRSLSKQLSKHSLKGPLKLQSRELWCKGFEKLQSSIDAMEKAFPNNATSFEEITQLNTNLYKNYALFNQSNQTHLETWETACKTLEDKLSKAYKTISGVYDKIDKIKLTISSDEGYAEAKTYLQDNFNSLNEKLGIKVDEIVDAHTKIWGQDSYTTNITSQTNQYTYIDKNFINTRSYDSRYQTKWRLQKIVDTIEKIKNTVNMEVNSCFQVNVISIESLTKTADQYIERLTKQNAESKETLHKSNYQFVVGNQNNQNIKVSLDYLQIDINKSVLNNLVQLAKQSQHKLSKAVDKSSHLSINSINSELECIVTYIKNNKDLNTDAAKAAVGFIELNIKTNNAIMPIINFAKTKTRTNKRHIAIKQFCENIAQAADTYKDGAINPCIDGIQCAFKELKQEKSIQALPSLMKAIEVVRQVVAGILGKFYSFQQSDSITKDNSLDVTSKSKKASSRSFLFTPQRSRSHSLVNVAEETLLGSKYTCSN